MTTFQADASEQGRQFSEQCDFLLRSKGFSLESRVVLTDVGVEIDRAARSRRGLLVWFEYKGSLRGARPGLRRTDTLKKAIANGALVRGLAAHPPFIVLTSHLPIQGSGMAMLDMANRLGYFHDVICIYDPAQAVRLDTL